MAELPLKLRDLLGYRRKNTIHFSDFIRNLLDEPVIHLQTSSSIISAAIKYFGHEIVIRSGEPVISYNVFRDPFNNGINAVFGQEFCIKQVLDIIESADKEVGPNRGIILVGPPGLWKNKCCGPDHSCFRGIHQAGFSKTLYLLFSFRKRRWQPLRGSTLFFSS